MPIQPLGGVQVSKYAIIYEFINLFAEQDKHLSKVNTMTQIVVQARLLLMKMNDAAN